MSVFLARLRRAMSCAFAAVLLFLAAAEPSMADADDLGICLDAKSTVQEYADAFSARGWRQVASGEAEHARAIRPVAEIIGTLRSFPAAFSKQREVREEVARVLALARPTYGGSNSALLVRGGVSLVIQFDVSGNDARLTCTLAARRLPNVERRLPEPGQNPSGEPLAWNLISSGPLPTRHIFAEILYVRLFFQPAQYLLAGGTGIVTNLTFRLAARAT